ncbi:hypothetical protein DFJ74DRAFT_773720 [Hyaloraphidium curvatum]|nr:hypothetical protein DFJ74DRAFT_773720 [Hyaloraphidium curvatum]
MTRSCTMRLGSASDRPSVGRMWLLALLAVLWGTGAAAAPAPVLDTRGEALSGARNDADHLSKRSSSLDGLGIPLLPARPHLIESAKLSLLDLQLYNTKDREGFCRNGVVHNHQQVCALSREAFLFVNAEETSEDLSACGKRVCIVHGESVVDCVVSDAWVIVGCKYGFEALIGPFDIKITPAVFSLLAPAHADLALSSIPVSWHFCGPDDLFEYAFLGNHNTATDYTCIAVKDHLAELRESGLDWDAFREAWKSERDTAGGQYRFSRFAKSLPFLGNLESSYGLEGASVHVLRRGGEVRGLLITSIPGDAD